MKKQAMIELQGKGAPENNAPARVLDLSILKDSDKKGLWEIIEHRVAYLCNPEWRTCHPEPIGEGSQTRRKGFFGLLSQNDVKWQKKQSAFTMAEVLITLGILGVVIAMTLPALIGNYQKKVLEVAFQKSVNTILNTNRTLMAKNDAFSLCDLVYYDCPAEEDYSKIMKVRDGFLDEYMHDLGFQKMEMDVGTFNDDFEDIYASKDGMCFAMYNDQSFTYSSDEYNAAVFVDTNCSKNPNRGGRDQFFIIITDKAAVMPWDTSSPTAVDLNICKELANGKVNSGTANDAYLFATMYCGAYLVNNGYKMDY